MGSGDVFTKGMMCELVYNALNANVMKTAYTSNSSSLYVDYNETMLSYYKDIYYGKGMVEAGIWDFIDRINARSRFGNNRWYEFLYR